MGKLLAFALSACLIGCSSSDHKTIFISPTGKTQSVPGETDDCAIWIHPTDRSLSLIIGNDQKGMGGLYAWDLKGHLVFSYGPLLKPTNVDVRYGFKFGGEAIDVLVVGTHDNNTLHVFKIDPILRNLVLISDPAGILTNIDYQLYGLALYQHPDLGDLSVFISQGKSHAPIMQMALKEGPQGTVIGEVLRQFGQEEVQSLVKGMYVDDDLGYLYCCDKTTGVLKFHADPALGNALIQRFAVGDGIEGDREAIGLYQCADQKGYLLLSCLGKHEIKVYDRTGDNPLLLTVKKRGVTHTDGMEVSSCAVMAYKHGFVVCHDNATADFVIYNWDDIAQDQLEKCACKTGY